MVKRPLSLTILAWFMLIGSLSGFYDEATTGSNPAIDPVVMKMIQQMFQGMHVSPLFEQVRANIDNVVMLACAFGVFKGLPWSRVLYVAWGIIAQLLWWFVETPPPWAMLPGSLFLALFAYFLFRPAADPWFAAKGLQLQRGVAGSGDSDVGASREAAGN